MVGQASQVRLLEWTWQQVHRRCGTAYRPLGTFFGNLTFFFFSLIFGNLVATIPFFSPTILATWLPQLFFFFSPTTWLPQSFFSPLTSLEFRQLSYHNWFFSFRALLLWALHQLGSWIWAKRISVTLLPKFNSFLTPLSHHFSLLNLLNNFEQYTSQINSIFCNIQPKDSHDHSP